ncbi:hypothetical protein K505DRAFT_324269 [Melanomma pulvis-pyrius CBS 109.77]|uniref:Uncharacterized protein n=1 Tax=Melanomma pulvis-pyrius CBS 109.77 TaxID=1314802 RepID=A0A6A6XFH4_9PLEO|nr:hypothetical protein K505DRAFT_324269 [Melanomma pulvis-pyrius CBS 109.77]
MSDYGDDYSDYGEDFFYVEDEYMVADDLAEHAVNSPPPTAYGDEDALSDWDRFDYFNDLEYASDGYDDGKFSPHDTNTAKTGEKRKRVQGLEARGKKKQKVTEGLQVSRPSTVDSNLPPVVWRAQAGRDPMTKMWDGNTESYALLKDWRERHVHIPSWATASPHSDSHAATSSKGGIMKAAFVAKPLSPAPEFEGDEDDEDRDETGIDPAVLMAAMQNRLAAAGGPLAGMDPQQLLQFAMRMMTNKDAGAGDDIAGELADELLDRGDEEGVEGEEGDEEAPADLLSWLDKQRQSDQDGEAATPGSLEINLTTKRPPTPPSSEANHSIRATEEIVDRAKGKNGAASKQKNISLEVGEGASSRKRKADDDVVGVGNSTNASKRRAARSYDAPTAASQARAAPTPKATRSGRAKRS